MIVRSSFLFCPSHWIIPGFPSSGPLRALPGAPLRKNFRKNPPFSLTGGAHEGKLLPRRWTGRLPRTEGGAAPAGPRGTLKTGRCTAREARGRGREIRMAYIHSFIT